MDDRQGTSEMTIDRRTLLALSLATFAGASGTAEAAAPIQRLRLWPGMPPGGGGPKGRIHLSGDGAVSNIAVPALEIMRPRHPNGAAVLVAAGGGYREIGMREEARPAMRFLAAHGFTAAALLYRLPGEGWDAGALAPLQDAQRAVRLLRAGRVAPGIAANRISVLGFSAGGHLMGLAATRFADGTYSPVDEADALSARPDAAALLYPVITLEPPFDDTSTRRVLVGAHPKASESAAWSVQTAIPRDAPPFFLVDAVDDPVVDPENLAIMAAACEAAGVPVDLHRLPEGGHGFGMGDPAAPASFRWQRFYLDWLRRTGQSR